MSTKQPTAQSISALLHKNGFERSTSRATRIKGWRESTAGYCVQAWGPGEVRVEHRTGRSRPTRGEVEQGLSEYAAVIAAAGYSVKRDDGLAERLVVTSKEAGQ